MEWYALAAPVPWCTQIGYVAGRRVQLLLRRVHTGQSDRRTAHGCFSCQFETMLAGRPDEINRHAATVSFAASLRVWVWMLREFLQNRRVGPVVSSTFHHKAPSMTEPTVLYTEQGAVSIATLNRPQALTRLQKFPGPGLGQDGAI